MHRMSNESKMVHNEFKLCIAHFFSARYERAGEQTVLNAEEVGVLGPVASLGRKARSMGG